MWMKDAVRILFKLRQPQTSVFHEMEKLIFSNYYIVLIVLSKVSFILHSAGWIIYWMSTFIVRNKNVTSVLLCDFKTNFWHWLAIFKHILYMFMRTKEHKFVISTFFPAAGAIYFFFMSSDPSLMIYCIRIFFQLKWMN